ncbi:MAG: 4-alpha-glucanotransferase [Bacteroidota bacterium]|nr:4-alpha-glucanotransferase [Bacteroidota bacterium]
MNYNSFLNSKSSGKWQRIGIQRRAGVTVPLFSIYSKNSVGIGELPDLRAIIDWCQQTGMSILQLLPLNEVGYDFAPYNAVSTFALEPMYLSIKKLRKVDLKPFRGELRKLKKKFPKGNGKVNYEIKNEKLKLLKKIFETVSTVELKKCKKFVEKNIHWLKYYSVFKILMELNDNKTWEKWELKYKYIAPLTTEKILRNFSHEINFYYWLQWQLYEQFTTIKKYAKNKHVLLTGDIPFLVSRNSADVWAYKNYFKLNLSSGAPPDMYFSQGQRWGMPPYNWENIGADNYGYIRERLKYAENFFDMFRIDHFIGLFRVWTMDLKTPEEYGGMFGKFDPEDQRDWEDHGKTILNVFAESSVMLPCAEDLGTVPKCSEKVLEEFGITGINVQRWEKKKNDNFNFLPAEAYRINSVATVSTHDSSSLPAWWKTEAGTIDKLSFQQACERLNLNNEKIEYLIKKLFVEKNSDNGRLCWRNEISNVYILLNIFNLSYEELKEIIGMYLSSYAEKNKFRNYIRLNNIELNASVEFIKQSLEKINAASSIFSIQLIMEYLYLDKNILEKFSGTDYRINLPGTVSGNNWSIVIPFSLEKLKALSINETIKKIHLKHNRI